MLASETSLWAGAFIEHFDAVQIGVSHFKLDLKDAPAMLVNVMASFRRMFVAHGIALQVYLESQLVISTKSGKLFDFETRPLMSTSEIET